MRIGGSGLGKSTVLATLAEALALPDAPPPTAAAEHILRGDAVPSRPPTRMMGSRMGTADLGVRRGTVEGLRGSTAEGKGAGLRRGTLNTEGGASRPDTSASARFRPGTGMPAGLPAGFNGGNDAVVMTRINPKAHSAAGLFGHYLQVGGVCVYVYLYVCVCVCVCVRVCLCVARSNPHLK
jgi:hypothetical protein